LVAILGTFEKIGSFIVHIILHVTFYNKTESLCVGKVQNKFEDATARIFPDTIVPGKKLLLGFIFHFIQETFAAIFCLLLLLYNPTISNFLFFN